MKRSRRDVETQLLDRLLQHYFHDRDMEKELDRSWARWVYLLEGLASLTGIVLFVLLVAIPLKLGVKLMLIWCLVVAFDLIFFGIRVLRPRCINCHGLMTWLKFYRDGGKRWFFCEQCQRKVLLDFSNPG